MSCEVERSMVHGYFDGELDAVRSTEFEHHLETCGECQAYLEQMESLRARLRETDLYEPASLRLRDQIRTRLRLAPPADGVPRLFARWRLLVPAFAVVAVAFGFTAAWLLLQREMQTPRITAELIDAHVRSLQPGHLTDVQSTDQHTVKPWFDGKLDFIPPVSDYAAQGFPLVGGRLDVVDGYNVAVLVYARRKHFMNLFVWPVRDGERVAVGSGSRQGYNWTMWQSKDMQLCLVSDASPADLRELEDLINR